MLGTTELIEGFYKEIVKDYPELSIEEVTKIVRSPFNLLKVAMRMPHMPTIRFKFFGKFIVHLGTQDRAENKTKILLSLGRISQEKHDKILTMLKLKKNES